MLWRSPLPIVEGEAPQEYTQECLVSLASLGTRHLSIRKAGSPETQQGNVLRHAHLLPPHTHTVVMCR